MFRIRSEGETVFNHEDLNVVMEEAQERVADGEQVLIQFRRGNAWVHLLQVWPAISKVEEWLDESL